MTWQDAQYVVNPAVLEMARGMNCPKQCKVICQCLFDMLAELGWRVFAQREICDWMGVNAVAHGLKTNQKPSLIYRYYAAQLVQAGILIKQE